MSDLRLDWGESVREDILRLSLPIVMKQRDDALAELASWREYFGCDAKEDVFANVSNPASNAYGAVQRRANEAEHERDTARGSLLLAEEDLNHWRKRSDEAHSALASAFHALHSISLLTRLAGEVDEYSEVTRAVSEIVDERDELRKAWKEIGWRE